MYNVPADTIRWGGQVYSKIDASPPMGSGMFRNEECDKTCYMCQVQAKSANLFTNVDKSFIKSVEFRCYLTGSNAFVDKYYRYRFVFGGIGGKKRDCLTYEKHDELCWIICSFSFYLAN